MTQELHHDHGHTPSRLALSHIESLLFSFRRPLSCSAARLHECYELGRVERFICTATKAELVRLILQKLFHLFDVKIEIDIVVQLLHGFQQ